MAKKSKTVFNLFGKKNKKGDEDLEASLMRYDRKRSSRKLQFDQNQTEMLDKIHDYHRVDITRLRQKFKKNHQFDAFIRKNQNNIDNARTANIVILGTSGSGKTKIWWNFLNYYRKSYLDSNSWGLSPKDFYYIITEKIMNISVDILIEYNYHRERIEGNTNDDPPSTCLSKNDLVEYKEYKLELDEDEDVKEGYLFFQDLISKLEKIAVAINANVQIEEKKKLDGFKPNWDKIQELRNIEKEIKEFSPSIAPKISKLWKSKQLREMYLYQYGLHNSRNLFYFIDNINKFVTQKQRLQDKEIISHDDNSTINNNNKKIKCKWEWEWGFEEILRCQIRTTGVIEQSSNLGPSYDNDAEKNFNLKLRLWDVGGAQNERKKWKYILNTKHDSPDIDCIIFVVNLMSYYKKSWESDKNGLLQSLQLFRCLLGHGDSNHDNNYHRINRHNDNDNDNNDEKNNDYNDLMNIGDPMTLARTISQEEYNICIDNQVKKAINDIGLFYIIFTDSEGLKEMLEKGISFKSCFSDYDGDNSLVSVQTFIENKFKAIVNESNARTNAKNGKLIKQNSESSLISDGQKPYLMRTGSLEKNDQNENEANIPLKRTKTVPNGIRMSVDNGHNKDNDDEFKDDYDIDDIDNMDNDITIEPEKQIEGQKRLKCRFVSVIDHVEMKSVMNEIVKSSFLNKNALDPVLHSLIDD